MSPHWTISSPLCPQYPYNLVSPYIIPGWVKLASIRRGTNLTFQNCPSARAPSYSAICKPTDSVNQFTATRELPGAQKPTHCLRTHTVPENTTLPSFSIAALFVFGIPLCISWFMSEKRDTSKSGADKWVKPPAEVMAIPLAQLWDPSEEV